MYPKVLIVTASIGAGHTRAAEAIRGELVGRGIADVALVDFLDDGDRLSRLIKEAYFKILGVFPQGYELLYRWSQEPRVGHNFLDLTALAMKRKMQQLISRYQPNVVIMTHPFPCCAAAYLRRSRQVGCPLVAVLTDFAVHRFWVHREIDAYFVANTDMKKALVALGIDAAAVRVSGIPVAREFATGRSGADRGDGVAEPAILIMGGGTGYGAMAKMLVSLESIPQKLKVTVVAGNNSGLRQRLIEIAKDSRHAVDVLGFTEKIGELMSRATLLVTKPGALSCSEALAVGLPMILVNPIPGQEEENSGYLLRLGAAIRIDDPDQIGQAVGGVLACPETLEAMREQAVLAGRPFAAAEIAREIDRCFVTRQASRKIS